MLRISSCHAVQPNSSPQLSGGDAGSEPELDPEPGTTGADTFSHIPERFAQRSRGRSRGKFYLVPESEPKSEPQPGYLPVDGAGVDQICPGSASLLPGGRIPLLICLCVGGGGGTISYSQHCWCALMTFLYYFSPELFLTKNFFYWFTHI